MLLGIVGAAKDEDTRKAGVIGFSLGVTAFITWGVIRVLERKLLLLDG